METTLSPLGVHGLQADLERLTPETVLEHQLRAQAESWRVLHLIRARLNVGMSEDDARRLALAVCRDSGVTKHWHRPYVRFGAGTILNYADPIQVGPQLGAADLVYLDLGPVWMIDGIEYEGDVGATFTMAPTTEIPSEKLELLHALTDVFEFGRALWKSGLHSGETLYARLETEANARGYTLNPNWSGHRIGVFPHQRVTKASLKSIPFIPTGGLWVLEVHLKTPDGKLGAFFEDVLV